MRAWARHEAILTPIHARLRVIRAWLMALTALQAAQVGALVTILVRQ